MIKLFTAANAAILLVNVFTAYLYLSPSLPTSLSARPHCHGQLAPLEPREWTLHDLRQHDGVADKRILIAVDWRVFDVTRDGSYASLAGRDATRALAVNKIYEFPGDFVQSWDDYLDLSDGERKTVNDWVDFYYRKYPEVGLLVRSKAQAADAEDVFSVPGSPPHAYMDAQMPMQ